MSDPSTVKLRLFVEADLGPGAEIALAPGQAHYIGTVMRRKPGDGVLLFNGRDGEWLAEIRDVGRKKGVLSVETQTRAQSGDPDLRLLFAPIKRTRLDYTIEKATELGVRQIRPMFTEFTDVERVNLERLNANAVEAAEQCRRLTVPEIAAPARSLEAALADLPAVCRRFVFDTGEGARPASDVLAGLPRDDAPSALIVGPEGGFSPRERALLKSAPNTYPMTLGPRILRADTAVVAALALWQAFLGDWR
jgi:16S rRNA (uracil1498-N3)-methyltransferase